MKPEIKLVRAVGSEFVRRKLGSAALPVGLVALILLIGSIYLTTLSAWWWLLASVIISAVVLLIIGYLLAVFASKLLRPKDLTKSQALGVREFVDKLERVAGNIGTPIFIIFFLVVRDVLWVRQPTYIQQVATDSTSLHSDLAKLQKLFV